MKSSNLKIVDSKEEKLAAKRADVRAVIALRDAVVAFNGEARDRSTLTLPDRRALAGITEALDVFQATSYRAALGDIQAVEIRPDSKLSALAAEIINAVRRYVAKTEGSMTVEVAGTKEEIPAIESHAIRAKNYADGQAIVEQLTGYVDHIDAAEKRHAEIRQREMAAFSAAMEIKPIGAMVAAFEALDATPELDLGVGRDVKFRLLDSISTLQDIYKRQLSQKFSCAPRDLPKLIAEYRNQTQTSSNTAA